MTQKTLSESELLKNLNLDLLKLSKKTREEVSGYNPSRFIQVLNSKDFFFSIKKLLLDDKPSEGLIRLFLEQKVEYSLEYFILNESSYHCLFDDRELDIVITKCKNKLGVK